MEAKQYWRTIHDQRRLVRVLKESMCETLRDKCRVHLVKLEDLQDSLIDDFRDKEGY